MAKNKWKKQNRLIQHTSLALAWGLPLFFLQLDLMAGYKIFLVCVSSVMSVVGGAWLTRRFAQSLVRVFRVEDAVAIGVVQRALQSSYIPFQRKNSDNAVRFDIRGTDLSLVVQDYPLNLPIGDQLTTVTASKIEIKGLQRANEPMADRLCSVINDSVALRVKTV